MATSFIYIIAPDNSDKVKIGFSKHPDKRVTELQTAQFEDLKLHFKYELDASKVKLIEKLIHKDNNHLRIKGEWFSMTIQEAIDYVNFSLIHWEDML